jgi:acetyl esterase/lipase
VYSPRSGVAAQTNVYVIIHGGYWESVWNVDNALIDTMAPILAANGHLAVEIEYRRADEGGYPGTNDDIVDALNTLIAQQPKVRMLQYQVDNVRVLPSPSLSVRIRYQQSGYRWPLRR